MLSFEQLANLPALTIITVVENAEKKTWLKLQTIQKHDKEIFVYLVEKVGSEKIKVVANDKYFCRAAYFEITTENILELIGVELIKQTDKEIQRLRDYKEYINNQHFK